MIVFSYEENFLSGMTLIFLSMRKRLSVVWNVMGYMGSTIC